MKALKSELIERNLRFDGVSEVEPWQLPRFLLLGVPPNRLRVTEETEDVQLLNEHVDVHDMVRVICEEPIKIDLGWQLPPEYVKLDLNQHMANVFFNQETQDRLQYGYEHFNIAIDRIGAELEEVERRGMTEFMRTVIFIIDELRKNNVVWGVGRGSSCASYLLFLIGLHVVDCVTMNVPLDEFYHD